MSKKSTKTATKAKKTPANLTIKKDAKGRFWVVGKDGGQEHGPYDTKKEATDAKAALASEAVAKLPRSALLPNVPSPVLPARRLPLPTIRAPGRRGGDWR